jgi:predicted DNA-binding ribbon-helix-helix protein
MERTQIMLEDEQRRILKEIAQRENRTFSEIVRKMLDEQIEKHQKATLAVAAQALLDDYLADKELTAFTALDGEDFHA